MAENSGEIAAAQLSVSGARDAGAEMASLRDWLANEPEFRGRVRDDTRPPETGEMGSISDVLIAALGSGGALTVLITSVTAWLQSRRSEISVELVDRDGKALRITASGPIATDVMNALDPPSN